MNPAKPPPPRQPQLPSPSSSLSSILTSLNHLISLSNHALSSSLNSNFTPRTSQKHTLVPCPFNHGHIMPPESLFSHFLHCPPPPPPLHLTSLLSSLNYQNTLPSSNNLRQTQNRFVQKVDDPNVELCFDLDEFITFGSNFFYKDCPGVVSLSDLNSVKKTVSLPVFLLIECENYVGFNKERESKGFGPMGFRVLASNLWEIRREIELWRDFPNGYSFNVCCAILELNSVKECDFKKWIIANSPRYGVVIDVYVGDHVFMLLSLCLKAIVREAYGLVSNALEGNLKNVSFRCPILVQVFTWLASQLSVLYGEVNGKYFALDVLKHCTLESASALLLFPLEKDTSCLISREGDKSLDTKDVKLEEPNERSAEAQIDKRVGETVGSGVVFVSQVAAAVAALHERSLLEERIKALRFSQPLPAHQRMAEHAYMSKRANEERRNRSNYRPIIEHDGLPRQLSSSQETNRAKTREELLAEERDYKRRRMSYRGKKVKRTKLGVMRDIIEEYMEEIKLAGGIGCFVKGAQEEGNLPSEPHFSNVANTDFEGRNDNSDSEAMNPGNYKKQSQNDNNIRSKMWEGASPKDYKIASRSLAGNHKHPEDSRRSSDRDTRYGEHHSERLERLRSHGRSDEWGTDQKERGDGEPTRTWHHDRRKQYSSVSSYYDNRSSYSISNSSSDFGVRKNYQKSEVKDRHQRKTEGNHSSYHLAHSTFEDRYDPSDFHDIYEDDVYTGHKFVKPAEN